MKEKFKAIVSKLEAIISWRNFTLYWFILGVVALVCAFNDPGWRTAWEYFVNIPAGCCRPAVALYLGTSLLMYALWSFSVNSPKSSK